MICTFFGHRDAPDNIKDKIKSILIELIVKWNADTFYIGNNGNFDYMTKACLKEIKEDFPHVKAFTVLAYMPTDNSEENTIFPSECGASHPKFAIARRNEWMIANSDIALTYVKHNWGGAWQYKPRAISKGLTVIETSN